MSLSSLAAATALAVSAVTSNPAPLLPDLGNDGYQVAAYDLTYDVDPATTLLPGTVRITAVAARRLSEFKLDYAGGAVAKVQVDGRPAAFHLDKEKLVVDPATAIWGPFTVTVDFTADRAARVPSVVDPTAGWSNDPDGGFAWFGQPDRAHLFFPCNDAVNDKAYFTYHVTVPTGWTAVANGALVARHDTKSASTFTYTSAHPLATQLAQLAVGKYALVTGTGPNGLPLRSAVPDPAAAKPVLDQLPSYLDWLQQHIGRPFPFETVGLLGAANRPMQTDALETQTLPVFEASALTKPENGYVVVHELAHQWFGDSAGIADWNDIWLSEGFASYFDHVYTAEHGGQPLADSLKWSYEVLDPEVRANGLAPANPVRPDLVFGLGRGEGALVVYALHEKVGDQVFRRIIDTYLDRYRDGSATSADFIRVATQVSGQDLGPFLHDWLYGSTTPPMPGHPDWTATTSATAGAHSAPAPRPGS
ncbi:M1 family metallopeptidase [Kutzneria buriramensis]|uniref:Aminopeptidase N n=1 Tax=Kutzneria buriramensis TaxID=1045776 RepID=A0A3E0HCK2_9PSEU|nr:M1 family metallopeptidase [Kutzneria buriramensis]REH42047.1 peptidase M1-like protein [Kutzneria buriramensis]